MAAVLALPAAGAAHAAHAKQRRLAGCPPRHVRHVAADTVASVFWVPERAHGPQEFSGCVHGSRRAFRLGLGTYECGSPSGCRTINDATLAGTVVAYEAYSFAAVGEEVFRQHWYVLVLDLRTGRVLHKAPTGVTEPPEKGFVGDGPTTAIVVKSDGAVAWITDTVQTKDRYQVHALDKNGERVLAVGSDIAPRSLALAGSTLYWTQGGKPFSASLQ